MADTYRAFLRGAGRWQDIAVIDLRSLDGTGKRLQTAGLKTLGEIDAMTGPAMLKLPGVGVAALVKSARGMIKTYKNAERRRGRAPVSSR